MCKAKMDKGLRQCLFRDVFGVFEQTISAYTVHTEAQDTHWATESQWCHQHKLLMGTCEADAKKMLAAYKRSGGPRHGSQDNPTYPIYAVPRTTVSKNVSVAGVLKFYMEMDSKASLEAASSKLCNSITNGEKMLETFGLSDRKTEKSIPLLSDNVLSIMDADDRVDALMDTLDPSSMPSSSNANLPKLLCDAPPASDSLPLINADQSIRGDAGPGATGAVTEDPVTPLNAELPSSLQRMIFVSFRYANHFFALFS